ncbi:hypothetical protein DPMN_118847 [Dreissena polymorpha]|uniref:Uncharacterized protein n=1 Tax=Dreissena polymorpha TaxID=45954 RepID=A0A9D4GHK8_DREPO|nr:hypothetical protein DPMN_118847 [Dreissena polymorpha]
MIPDQNPVHYKGSSGGIGAQSEVRKISGSGQRPFQTYEARWKGIDCSSYKAVPEDLGIKGVESVPGIVTTAKWLPPAVR